MLEGVSKGGKVVGAFVGKSKGALLGISVGANVVGTGVDVGRIEGVSKGGNVVGAFVGKLDGTTSNGANVVGACVVGELVGNNVVGAGVAIGRLEGVSKGGNIVGAFVGELDGTTSNGANVVGDCVVGKLVGDNVVGSAVGLLVGATVRIQVRLLILFVSNVTAPPRAIALPVRFTPVVSVILAAAMIFPANTVFVPNVAELPTCQKTWQALPPLIMFTVELEAVVSVEPILKIKTAFGSPVAFSVSVPVNWAEVLKQ
jgi:hypothetical protein